MSRLALLSVAALVAGCSAKTAADAPAKAEAGPAEPAKVEPPTAEPAKAEAPSSGAGSPGSPGSTGLGGTLRDPSWFRKEIWPGATVTSSGRSEADAQGLFSSQILLDLPAGITAEVCAQTLMDKIRADVPDIALKPDPNAPAGRVTARGENEFYRVSLVCGEAKGVMKGYLSYVWTKVPPAG